MKLLLALIFAIWCSSMAASSFNLDKNRESRLLDMVLENLRRFHNGEEPIVPKVKSIQTLPLARDIYWNICSEFLSLKDANNFFSTCKYTDQMRSEMIKSRLVEFSKYYVFEEQWLNNMMYYVIEKNFPAGMTLHSEGIQDQVELMTLNFKHSTFDEIWKAKIPYHLYKIILAFIHETVYGPGYALPPNKSHAYTAFKIKGFNLPLAMARYVRVYGKDDAMNRFYQFFSVPRSEREKDEYASMEQQNGEFIFDFAHFEWNFHGVLPENEAIMLLQFLREHQIYSEHIMKRIELTENIDKFLVEMTGRPLGHIFLMFRRYLHRKAGHELVEPVFDCASYIKTRDLNKRFDMDEFTRFADFEPWSAFRLIVTTDLPHLIKMDMLAKMARSGLVALNLKEPNFIPGTKSALQLLAEIDAPFLELVLTNYPRLVNFRNFEYPFAADVSYFKRMYLLVNQIPKNDPLTALKYMIVVFPVAKRLNYAGMFDLNVAYRFDCHFGFLIYGQDLSLNWKGKTMTFREILREVKRKFSVIDYEDFFAVGCLEESEEMKASYPVISLSSYLKDPNSVL